MWVLYEEVEVVSKVLSKVLSNKESTTATEEEDRQSASLERTLRMEEGL